MSLPQSSRRNFLKNTLIGAGALIAGRQALNADISSGIKITKIRHHKDPNYTKPTFAQARDIVVVETDAGISGIGEGGALAMALLVVSLVLLPFLDQLWQVMAWRCSWGL